MFTAEKINFGYKVSGGRDEHLRPIRVYDDGAKTYIQMRPEIQNWEAPALVVLGSDGKGEMTNYRVREQTYIVDKLFDRAQLVLGWVRRPRKWRSAVNQKDEQTIDAPAGIDLHPSPRRLSD